VPAWPTDALPAYQVDLSASRSLAQTLLNRQSFVFSFLCLLFVCEFVCYDVFNYVCLFVCLFVRMFAILLETIATIASELSEYIVD